MVDALVDSRSVPGIYRHAPHAAAGGGTSGPPVVVPGWNRERGLVRRTLIAAVIATGLVILWAMLLPLMA